MHAKFPGTQFAWTIHVINEIKNALLMPIIKLECATHLNCSKLFQSYLQRNIVSCRGGNFRDVKVANFCKYKLITA